MEVVVNFLSQANFYFSTVFGCGTLKIIIYYANEFETKEKQELTEVNN